MNESKDKQRAIYESTARSVMGERSLRVSSDTQRLGSKVELMTQTQDSIIQ